MENDHGFEQKPPREGRRDYTRFFILLLAPCVGSILVGLLGRSPILDSLILGIVLLVPLVCGLWAGRIAGRWIFPNRSGGLWEKAGRSAGILLICLSLVVVDYSLCAAGCSVAMR